MNIPDEVLHDAYKVILRRSGEVDAYYQDGIEAAFQVVAEWARKEALREAADAIDSLEGSRATGYYASEAHSGYQEAQRDAEYAIRALADGKA